jgi:hypothetical protein
MAEGMAGVWATDFHEELQTQLDDWLAQPNKLPNVPSSSMARATSGKTFCGRAKHYDLR